MQGRRRDLGPHTRHCRAHPTPPLGPYFTYWLLHKTLCSSRRSRTFSWSLLYIDCYTTHSAPMPQPRQCAYYSVMLSPSRASLSVKFLRLKIQKGLIGVELCPQHLHRQRPHNDKYIYQSSSCYCSSSQFGVSNQTFDWALRIRILLKYLFQMRQHINMGRTPQKYVNPDCLFSDQYAELL